MTNALRDGPSRARLWFGHLRVPPRLLLLAFLATCAPRSFAATSDYGVVGYLDMPSAAMRADGTFTTSVAQQDTVDLYGLTYQALPWVEASFRYAVLNPGGKDESRESLRDRSFGIKVRLLEEGRHVPAVAVGLRDLFGTGVFPGEYVVATKNFGPLEASVGAGWGRFSGRNQIDNPLRLIDERFRRREGFRPGDQGGELLTGTFFRGPDLGFFGGASYDLPFWNLELVGEYSSDTQDRARAQGTISDADPVAYGLRWKPLPGLELTASRQLGQDFTLTLSAALDTKTTPPPQQGPAFWSSSEARARSSAPAGLDLSSWYNRLLYDVERSGLLLISADLTDGENIAWLEIENTDYAVPADAVRQVLTFAEVHLPPRVHTINVLLDQDGIKHAALSYRRRLGRTIGGLDDTDPGSAIDIIPARGMPEDPRFRTRFRIPNLANTVTLANRLQVMDPDDPLRYQFLARIASSADLGNDVYLRGAIGINLYNDFDDIERTSNSRLPRVRSLVAQYLQDGETGIESLYLEKRGMLSSAVSYRAYAGILEQMYSGAGGEVLWHPFGSRVAFGLNANWVRQRDFDGGFGHRNFETVTAHASMYWATPMAGYDVAVHAGRYLARDVGATMVVRRTFDNGWMLGAFATLTDVPFEVFGEGSFDKGLYFRIPLGGLMPGNTRAAYATRLRLLQRDGGQRLEDFGTTLWWEGRASRTDALVRHRARMVPR